MRERSPGRNPVRLTGNRGPLGETADMIAFKHSVFALPFALMSLITAAGAGWPSIRTWAWVIVAMVAARTSAMGFNRLADHDIDSNNPRTADRALPAGRLSRRFTWFVTGGSAGVFVVAAAMLNTVCLVLAVPTLAVLFGYSYAKRFTSAAHLWLGSALGIAPIGAWIAVTGTISVPAVILGAAVMLWVAGFDTIYSLQDESFDRLHGLRSLPARFGSRRALAVARGLHLLALVGFAAFAVAAGGRGRGGCPSHGLAASIGPGRRSQCGRCRVLHGQWAAVGGHVLPLHRRQVDRLSSLEAVVVLRCSGHEQS